MSTEATTEQTKVMKTYLLPALAAIVPLVIAFGGALLTGTGTTAVVDNALRVSGGASQQLEDLSSLLPLGFAFGAGLVASVNPCGFAMLPAYLALYMGSTAEAEQQANVVVRLGKAILVGAVVTLGFIVLFGIAGLIIGGGARQVIGVIPWIGLTIGIVLTLVGGWLLSGGKIYTAIAQQASTKFGDPSKVGVKGYFLFGLSYGTASLSCTLPIFIAVLGIGVATNTLARLARLVPALRTGHGDRHTRADHRHGVVQGGIGRSATQDTAVHPAGQCGLHDPGRGIHRLLLAD